MKNNDISNKTVGEIFEEYSKYIEMKLKYQTVRSIKSRFKTYILPYFENTKIVDITPKDYLKWQKMIFDKDFSYSHKKTLHYTFSELYSYLDTFYDYRDNVVKKVGALSNYEIPKEMNYWTIEEFNKFIKKISKEDWIYKFFFEFLFYTGTRLGEANALTFNDVEYDLIFINKTISKEIINGKRQITTPKTKTSIRRIKIDNILVSEINELKEYYKQKYSDFNENFYIFGGKSPLSPTTIKRKKDSYAKKAKIKTIRLHDFRHSHATLLLKNNIPIEEISKRLGHENLSTTLNTYIHLMPLYEKRVVNTLNSLHH